MGNFFLCQCLKLGILNQLRYRIWKFDNFITSVGRKIDFFFNFLFSFFICYLFSLKIFFSCGKLCFHISLPGLGILSKIFGNIRLEIGKN